MTTTSTLPATALPDDTSRWTGHPRGLSTLFFVEMWERFSYYGMRAFLILYITAPATNGGLGFTVADAAALYGNYTMSAWGAAVFGGFIADRFLGHYRSVLVGGAIIALGHFTLAFESLPFFYTGLTFIVIGTGLLKPNASTLVGALYEPGDKRRDAGFSFFYMGINLGAMLGPLIAGYLAQRVSWHAGFAAAGFGMAIGLIQYTFGRSRLQPAAVRLQARNASAVADPASAAPASGEGGVLGFTTVEWKRIGAVLVFFLFAGLFWGAYEQAGSTLTLFADRYTRTEILGFNFPSSWFQSVQAIFVIILAPIFAWLWIRLGRYEPSSPMKFTLGLFFAGVSFLLLVPAGALAQSGEGIRVSPWWLIWSYFIVELGEMCLSPVGLSLVTKLSPTRIVGLMMGVFFLSNALGNKLAGSAAAFFTSMPIADLFSWVAGITLGAAFILFLLIRPLRRMMGGVL